MSVEIQLTRGYVAVVDDCDADLAEFRWRTSISKNGRTEYAIRTDGKNTVSMHRVILERILGRALVGSEKADHWNNNGLINTRANLRLATSQQNLYNRDTLSNSTMPYKGVMYSVKDKTWRGRIRLNGKDYYFKARKTPLEAHKDYCISALINHAPFHNFGSNSPFAEWTLEMFELPLVNYHYSIGEP